MCIEKCKASISVFLALCLLCIMSFFLSLLESARCAGTALYAKYAVGTTMDSLFSQYHRKLWEEYRILGVEYPNETILKTEFCEFMEPYRDAENWYPVSLSENNIRILDISMLTEKTNLEDEIIEYMKHWTDDLDFLSHRKSVSEVVENVSELAVSLKHIDQVDCVRISYLELSDYLEQLKIKETQIRKLIERCNQIQQEAEHALRKRNLEVFIQLAEEDIHCVHQLNGMISYVFLILDQLMDILKESENRIKKETGEDIQESLLQEIAIYRINIEKNRTELKQIFLKSERLMGRLRMILDKTQKEYEALMKGEEGNSETGRTELCARIHNLWRDLERLNYFKEEVSQTFEFEKEIKKQNEHIKTGLLKLVLPDQTKLSDQTYEKRELYKIKSKKNLYRTIITSEYGLRFFNHAGKQTDGSMELEYIISGAENDMESVDAVIKTIFKLKSGFNLLAILRDHKKMEYIQHIAAEGVAGSIAAGILVGGWAAAQTVCDLKGMLIGNDVPILHTEESWTLGIEELKKVLINREFPAAKDTEGGADYSDWLRVMLYMNRDVMLERMADCIERKLTEVQSNFTLQTCMCTLETSTIIDTRHIMYLDALMNRPRNYKIKIRSYKSFIR